MIIIGDSNSTFIKLNGFENLSEPGFRVKDVLDKLKTLTSGEILIIGVGVNDSATIKDDKSGNKIEPNLQGFQNDYYELLSLAKSKFNRVIVLGLIHSTEERVRLGNAEIRYSNRIIVKFNEVIRSLCKDLGIEFIDLLPYFLNNEDELLKDHIHPNQKGRQIIVSELSYRI